MRLSGNSENLKAWKLIIASNRGPIEYRLNKDNKLEEYYGTGGLIAALKNVPARISKKATWVALTMTEGDRFMLKQIELPSRLFDTHGIGLHYINIPKKSYHKHYNLICNQILWFFQHNLQNLIAEDLSIMRHIHDSWSNGYCVANQAIADAVSQDIDNNHNCIVMLHDYHLYLAPAMIRKLQPSSIITHFIHIPWPDARCWQLLPSNITYDIFNSMVSGNDIVGFQTSLDARNFLEGAHSFLKDSIVDFENRVISSRSHDTFIRIYPISISIVEERHAIRSAKGKQAAAEITLFMDKKIIMRVDRIDPVKNIVNGFHAYSELLNNHSELCGRVVFLAFLLSSRQTLSSYRHYRAQIVKTVDKINKKYGSNKWMPIRIFFDKDRTFVLSAMRFYDVLFVNPIFDGMNLVAKEGPNVNQKNGVLVLSCTAGAYQQLKEAIIPISPIDVSGMAEAMYEALTLSNEERKKKWGLARKLVKNYDLNAWFNNQMHDINEILNKKTIQ